MHGFVGSSLTMLDMCCARACACAEGELRGIMGDQKSSHCLVFQLHSHILCNQGSTRCCM